MLQEVAAVARAYRRNRFMPLPPSERNFAGDGDFRAIGAEFLSYFVRLGGLYPRAKVLEIGCGIGRMALPLTQYLTGGAYDGVDVVRDGVEWCGRSITPAYGNFHFRHLDYRNPVYNPDGTLKPGTALPFGAASFDFVIMTSVVTHLDEVATRFYAAEVARLLRPGGRAFLSLFLMTDAARAGCKAGASRFAFDPEAPGPAFEAEPDRPGHAVAFDEAWLMDLFAGHGLRRLRPVAYGAWSGRDSRHYQDLCVLEKHQQESVP